MRKVGNKQTEDFLRMFSLKPSPPGLKEKILDDTLQKQNSNHARTAFLWKGFVGCLFLLFLVIVVDAAISKAQKNRFSSILDTPQESLNTQEEEWSMLKEIIGETLGSSENALINKFYVMQEKSKNKRRQLEWRESLEKEFE